MAESEFLFRCYSEPYWREHAPGRSRRPSQGSATGRKAAARRLSRSLAASAISGLTLEHVTCHVGGIELFLSRRKYDQDARATRLWLPRGRTDLCPGKALEALN